MLSKTLSFNRGIIKQASKSVGWISIAYFLCLLFTLPLQLLMTLSREDTSYRYKSYFIQLKSLFEILPEFQLIAIFVAPVLLSVFLFRYLQVKLPADYMHSLPIRREALFHQYIILGALMLILPVLLTGVILLLMSGYLPAENTITFGMVMSWIGITTLFNLFVFFAGVFVAMFTGISVLQAALTYILFLFPSGLTMLLLSNLDFFLYGFSLNYHMSENIERIIPYVRTAMLTNEPMTFLEILSYTLLTILFYITALLAYRKRHIESAAHAISVKYLRPVFLYGVTFCTMLLGGVYFGQSQGGSLGWIIFGYISASLLGYVIAQMILEKTWRIFDKWKGLIGFAICIALIGMVISFDITGYEDNLPAAENVKQIKLASGVYQLSNEYRNYDDFGNPITPQLLDSTGNPLGRELYTYISDENIANIIKLHQQVITDKQLLKDIPTFSRTIVIAYELNNGHKLVREYLIPENVYQDLFLPIMETNEYKYNQLPLLRIDDLSKLNTVTINSNYMGKRLVISDTKLLAELHHILQTEMWNRAPAEMFITGYEDAWAAIEYSWQLDKQRTRTFYYDWMKSYQLLEDWLIDNDLLEKARYTANDIAKIAIIENENYVDTSMTVDDKSADNEAAIVVSQNGLRRNYPTRDVSHPNLDELADLENPLIIEDKEQIDQIIRAAKRNFDAKYYVFVFFNGETRSELMMLNVDKAPAFVTDGF